MSPKLNVIDIVVPDLDAAIAFYAKLGLAFEPDPRMPGHAGYDLPNGPHLMLDTDDMRGKPGSEWTPETGGTGGPRTVLGFEYPTSAEVDAAFAELTGAGYSGLQEPWDAYWGMRYASVSDPGGNAVDLYAMLPSS